MTRAVFVDRDAARGCEFEIRSDGKRETLWVSDKDMEEFAARVVTARDYVRRIRKVPA